MISLKAIRLILRHFDSIDYCVSKRLMRKRPWSEPALTSLLCDLLDQDDQVDEKSRVDRFLPCSHWSCASVYSLVSPTVSRTHMTISVGPDPSQNRACAIYAHGSSHGNSRSFRTS